MRMFLPPKPSHYFCCWDHHELHYAQHDYRGDKRSADERYDRGYNDAWRQAKPSAEIQIPRGVWKGLMLFSHPDKWQSEPELLPLANKVTRWLIEHKPVDAERNWDGRATADL
jgi:hypothetical protein